MCSVHNADVHNLNNVDQKNVQLSERTVQRALDASFHFVLFAVHMLIFAVHNAYVYNVLNVNEHNVVQLRCAVK